ncbi:hypothetical protein Hanom_Chr04g00377751 [Helianthus anomalus]
MRSCVINYSALFLKSDGGEWRTSSSNPMLLQENYEINDISELNLVMGIGTQTQQLIEYCSTSVQLMRVSCDVVAREASNKNKKVRSF